MTTTGQLELAPRYNPQGLLPEDFTWQQEFDRWKETQFGGHLLQHIFRQTAYPYGENFVRFGRQVSIKLIFELVRYKMPWIKQALVKRGIRPTRNHGFALNNNYTAPAARHIMEHRPAWDGIFVLHETGQEKIITRTTVIRETVVRPATSAAHCHC